jgi:hypothetical protein
MGTLSKAEFNKLGGNLLTEIDQRQTTIEARANELDVDFSEELKKLFDFKERLASYIEANQADDAEKEGDGDR